jgi:hypothetical protein
MHLLALVFLFGQTRHVKYDPEFEVLIGSADGPGIQLIRKALDETKTPYHFANSLGFYFFVSPKEMGSLIANLGDKLAAHHRYGVLYKRALEVDQGSPPHWSQTHTSSSGRPVFTVLLNTGDKIGAELVNKAMSQTKTDPVGMMQSVEVHIQFQPAQIGPFIANLSDKLWRHNRYGILYGDSLTIKEGNPPS